jgi:hypothetical protein
VYLGIDFLVTPDLEPRVIEVNVGLPGGAQEYDRACLVRTGRASGVFRTIEAIAREAYGLPFKDYLDSLPWLAGLKAFKLWMDGQGDFPMDVHPGLRLEDKWVQYGILRSGFPVPETIILDPEDRSEALAFLARQGRIVGKRRLGRGGRGLLFIDRPEQLPMGPPDEFGRLLQERIDSRLGPTTFSIRSVAFGGRHVCMYANLADRPFSNHGLVAMVEPGDGPALAGDPGRTRAFDERSWEAQIWFGDDGPDYLRHNLFEDVATEAALVLPGDLVASIRDLSVGIERLYESLDPEALPRAWFEERGAAASRRP